MVHSQFTCHLGHQALYQLFKNVCSFLFYVYECWVACLYVHHMCAVLLTTETSPVPSLILETSAWWFCSFLPINTLLEISYHLVPLNAVRMLMISKIPELQTVFPAAHTPALFRNSHISYAWNWTSALAVACLTLKIQISSMTTLRAETTETFLILVLWQIPTGCPQHACRMWLPPDSTAAALTRVSPSFPWVIYCTLYCTPPYTAPHPQTD